MARARLTTPWRSRALAFVLTATLALGGAAGAPLAYGVGLEGGGAASELTGKGNEETTSTATTATTSSETQSSSKGTIVLAIVAGGLLLSAIAFVIVRDARRVAPVGDEEMLQRRLAHDPAVTMRKRRAKAKAARRQRKRNR